MPSVALTVATSGAGATAAVGAEMSAGAKVGAALGAAAKSAVGPGNFDPHYAESASVPKSALDPTTQSLIVPVGGSGAGAGAGAGSARWVGVDPATGDFVVDRGSRVDEHRWSHLSDDEQDALRDQGLVDSKGHLIGA